MARAGVFTAVVAGFLISALGGSRVQIGGPTGAFIVLVYGIVQTHGYDGLAVATMMAGGLMVLMGIALLGNVIKPSPTRSRSGSRAGSRSTMTGVTSLTPKESTMVTAKQAQGLGLPWRTSTAMRRR